MYNYGNAYDYFPHWPAVLYNFREDGVSYRTLPRAKMADIPKLCDYYEEQLKLCALDDRENMKLVQAYINQIRGQAVELSQQDSRFEDNMSKARSIEEEFAILKGGDLEGDPPRTPELMHLQLLQVESDYTMLVDAIESYKRRIKMLEESLPNCEDKNIY